MNACARILAAAFLLMNGATVSAQLCLDISTGYDEEAGAVLAEGTPDDDYTVDEGFGAAPALTGGGAQAFPIPPWVANDGESLWISSSPSSIANPGTYLYEVLVSVPPEVNPARLSIAGKWTADDQAADVLVNGTPTGLATSGFDHFENFPNHLGLGLFQPGLSSIQFSIQNGGTSPNPAGLRVRACVVEATPDDRAHDISTGFDDDGLAPLPNGSQDAEYAVTGPPGSGIGPDPAVVVTDTSLPAGWLPTSIQSKWVGPAANAVGPAGEYIYTITVGLDAGVDVALSALLGGFASDDEVADVRINGSSTGIAAPGSSTLNPFPADAGRGLFVTGPNTITFVVINGANGPTGLHVNGEVTACPIPPPFPAVSPGSFSVDTGFEDEGARLIANGLFDDGFELIGPSGTGVCRTVAIVVNDDAYPIPPWIGTTFFSKWISAGADSSGPPGSYRFRIRADLPGDYPAGSARLIGRWTTDNAGIAVEINGSPSGVVSNGNFEAFQDFSPDAGFGLFHVGENLIEFVVDNAPPGSNPIGLRVEAVVGVEEPRPDDLSTGVGARGEGPFSGGTTDSRWIVTGPAGSGIGPRRAVAVKADGFPIPPWLANTDLSRWVGLDGDDSIGPAGIYAYALRFPLASEVNPERVMLTGGFAASDRATDVLLNGISLGLADAGPSELTPIPPPGGDSAFIPGANELRFVVENPAQGPTGVRVEAKFLIVLEPNPLDISTGLQESDPGVIADGQPDDDYSVTGPDQVTDIAVVVTGAPIPPWIPNSASSRWIGIFGADVNAPPGRYVYETLVSLTADQAAAAHLAGGFAADDGGTEVHINGVSAGITSLLGFGAFTFFGPDAGKGLFLQGDNSIQFVVENGGVDPNPTGLRVDAIVKVPRPATGPRFVRGDVNADGKINITDPIALLGYLFQGGTAPACVDAADADDQFKVNITDPIYILTYMFQGGPRPPAPTPDPANYDPADCGPDPDGDADGVGCAGFPPCGG